MSEIMTDAQVALLAASMAGQHRSIETVHEWASENLSWLAAQNATPPVSQAVSKSARCSKKSPTALAYCDLPAHHGGKCINEHEGITWGGTGL